MRFILFLFIFVVFFINFFLLKNYNLKEIFFYLDSLKDQNSGSIIFFTIIALSIYIMLQGFFSLPLILIPILFNFIESLFILIIGSFIGNTLTIYYLSKIDLFKKNKIYIRVIDEIKKNKLNNFHIFFIFRFLGGLNLPNQVQLLIGSTLKLNIREVLIINFFSQVHIFAYFTYIINKIELEKILNSNFKMSAITENLLFPIILVLIGYILISVISYKLLKTIFFDKN